MKILLTGSCGYVGAALRPKLEAAGYQVWGVDTKWFYEDGLSIKDDVRSFDIYEGGYDVIIHLAAIANDPSVDFYPRRSWETGCLSAMRLAQAALKTGARFIYASSVSVYGADRGMVTEDMDLRPLSDYNKTKMATERVLLSYAAQGMHLTIVRPATICGLSPRMRLDLSVNTMTIQALTRAEMTVFGGQQWRPSIHIDDMCDLYLWLLDNGLRCGYKGDLMSGVFNAGFENYKLIEIAQAVRDHLGSAIKVTPEVDRRSYQVNSDKLLSAGFKPKKTIHDAIIELRDAYRAGTLRDTPQSYNLGWMKHLGIEDK